MSFTCILSIKIEIMSHLLTLPREIRDRIIEFSITHHATAPETPQDAGPQVELEDIDYSSPTGGKGVKYSVNIPNTSPLSLLVTSHQIRAETISALGRLRHNLISECDVLIVDEKELFVTWTYVPPMFRRHPSLPYADSASPTLPRDMRIGVNASSVFKTVFNIRSHGIFKPTPDSPVSGFEDFPSSSPLTGPGPVLCGFCAVFERFLRVGPGNYPAPNRHYDRGRTVGYAQLNIVTPDSPSGFLRKDVGPHWARETRERTGGSEMIHPRALLGMLTNWFWAADYMGRQVDDTRADKARPKELGELLARVSGLAAGIDGEVGVRFANWELDGMWEEDDERLDGDGDTSATSTE
jgi:hypothetical protein